MSNVRGSPRRRWHHVTLGLSSRSRFGRRARRQGRERGDGPSTNAEPRPVWIIVNTMNNIYSERLACIDRFPPVCAAHLFLLRIDPPPPSLWKTDELDEMKTLPHTHTHNVQYLHAYIISCLWTCVRSLVDNIRVNQQGDASYFPLIR